MATVTMRTLRTQSLFSSASSRSTLFLQNTIPASPFQPLSSPSTTATSHKSFRSYSTETSSPDTTIKSINTSLNPPSSTLPPPLETPIRDPSQPAPLYYFALGKAYLTFYKTGAKAIYTNQKLSRAVSSRLPSSIPLNAAAADGHLTRSDYQLLLRNRHDIARVPIFGLIFLVCGELTPLIVVAISNVVPYTCRIPKQINGDIRTLETRRATSFRNLTNPAIAAGYEGPGDLDRMQLLHINWSLGLSSRIWDYLGGSLPGLPTALLRSKVQKRVEYLETDDSLILRDGSIQELAGEEVKIACVERGIDVLERSEEELRDRLEKWLLARWEGMRVEELLLTR
jgi:hypothetical protein